MIVVDSSVVVAILQREPDAPTWIEVFDQSSKALMSVVSFVPPTTTEALLDFFAGC